MSSLTVIKTSSGSRTQILINRMQKTSVNLSSPMRMTMMYSPRLGINGQNGKSAYQIALENGLDPAISEAQWALQYVPLTSPQLTYTLGKLSRIDYADGSIKEFTYTDGLLTRMVLTRGVFTYRKTFYSTDGRLDHVDGEYI